MTTSFGCLYTMSLHHVSLHHVSLRHVSLRRQLGDPGDEVTRASGCRLDQRQIGLRTPPFWQ